MASLTAPLQAHRPRPVLRLVRAPLDLDVLVAQWRVALDAADRALAASGVSLKPWELTARREQLRLERMETAAELRRFAHAVGAPADPDSPGGQVSFRRHVAKVDVPGDSPLTCWGRMPPVPGKGGAGRPASL